MIRPLLAAAIAALFLAPAAARADPCEGPLPTVAGRTFSGPVRYVGDGDSLCVGRSASPKSWIEVRLADFDAPELQDARGARAKALLQAVKGGQPEQPLIDYADFADYRQIIERKDNWNTVFKPVFGRAEDVRESFQRLFPVRIATMHARIVTQDDELLLVVETKRVLKAIRRIG